MGNARHHHHHHHHHQRHHHDPQTSTTTTPPPCLYHHSITALPTPSHLYHSHRPPPHHNGPEIRPHKQNVSTENSPAPRRRARSHFLSHHHATHSITTRSRGICVYEAKFSLSHDPEQQSTAVPLSLKADPHRHSTLGQRGGSCLAAWRVLEY